MSDTRSELKKGLKVLAAEAFTLIGCIIIAGVTLFWLNVLLSAK